MRKIEKAVRMIGKQQKLASLLAVSQSTISDWARGKREVPAKYLRPISTLTKNKVTIKELLSDHEQ